VAAADAAYEAKLAAAEAAAKLAAGGATASAAAAEAAAKATQEATKRAAFNDPTIQEQIQMILALKDADTNLAAAWNAYLAGDVDTFRSSVLASNFYKNNSALARQRQTAKINQRGAYDQQLNDYKANTKRRLIAVGVKWTDALEAQAEVAFDKGLSDTSLDEVLISTGAIGQLGGSTLTAVNALKTFANDYGVSNLYNKAYWDSKATGIFAGTTTLEDIQQEIQTLSASAFPAYADGIAKGISLKAQGSSVLQTVATYLEKDPDTLSFDDPLVKQIMQYVDPVTGKPARMPQWEAEKVVKGSKEWPETKNARDTIDNLSYKVLRDWGLA
jgi:hypothetical protein